VTTVDIEGLLAQDDLRALLDACEQRGTIRARSTTYRVDRRALRLGSSASPTHTRPGLSTSA
jgi:hypothetical protein